MSYRYLKIGPVLEMYAQWDRGAWGRGCYLGNDPDAFEVWAGPIYLCINRPKKAALA